MVPAFLKSMYLRFFLSLAVLTGVAWGQSKSPANPLPQTFSGWRIDAQSVKISRDPAVADVTDAPVLKEDGFTDRKLPPTAATAAKCRSRPRDSTMPPGAFGAFTYYVQPQMQVEKDRRRGASSNTRVSFLPGGNILVDVSLEHLSRHVRHRFASLADALPRLSSENGKLPSLPALICPHSHCCATPAAISSARRPWPAWVFPFPRRSSISVRAQKWQLANIRPRRARRR